MHRLAYWAWWGALILLGLALALLKPLPVY